MIFKQIQKQYAGEALTLKDAAKDAAFGAALGAVTGPIGVIGGSQVTESTSTLVKFGIRSLVGSSAGAASGAVVEGSRYLNGDQVSLSSLKNSVTTGATAGFVGAGLSHFASSASNQISSGLSKAAVRIGVQTAATAATDAGIQLAQNGTVDTQQLIINTTGQVVVSTAAEAGSSMAQRTTAYNNKINNKLIDSKNPTAEERAQIKSVLDEANSLKSNSINRKRVGEHKIHALDRNRRGQIAGDIKIGGDDVGRGKGRVISEKQNGKYVYVDHTLDHDYKSCKSTASQIPVDGKYGMDEMGKFLTTKENLHKENTSKFFTGKDFYGIDKIGKIFNTGKTIVGKGAKEIQEIEKYLPGKDLYGATNIATENAGKLYNWMKSKL